MLSPKPTRPGPEPFQPPLAKIGTGSVLSALQAEGARCHNTRQPRSLNADCNPPGASELRAALMSVANEEEAARLKSIFAAKDAALRMERESSTRVHTRSLYIYIYMA